MCTATLTPENELGSYIAMTTNGESLPTKDLFDRFVKSRDSTRWSAIYLFTAAALLLAWSRSPTWHAKVPFELFVDDAERPLAVPCGFAPIFGPVIILFFYVHLYTLHRDVLSVGKVLRKRLPVSSLERSLIDPTFHIWNGMSAVESALFVMLVLLGVPVLTGFLFADFLSLHDSTSSMWQTFYKPCTLFGVVPEHRGHSAKVYVYGLLQLLIYLALTAFEAWIMWRIGNDVCTYDSTTSTDNPGHKA
jgi:hypothetical protein